MLDTIRSRPSTTRRELVLATLVLAAAWLALAVPDDGGLAPPLWPAAGLAAGLLVTCRPRAAAPLLVLVGAGLVAVHVAHGADPAVALGLAASACAELLVVRRLLATARVEPPPLLVDGDVSRLIRALALGAAVGAAGYGLTGLLSGAEDPWLTAVAAWGTHAAAMMILVPLFLRTPAFPPLATVRERTTQWVLALGTTVVIFSNSDFPPAVFLLMPMFAWLGFRGTLRESTLVLLGVGAVATTLTVLGVGPVWGLGERYALPPELVIGYLQLFLLDCGLLLLPLSVSAAHQRRSEAREAAGRATLKRIVGSATGTAIIATDRTGAIVLFNPGAEAMLGHAAVDVLGDLPDRFHPAEELSRQASELGTAPVFADICRAVTASDRPRRLWTFRRGDGELRTMMMTIAALVDEDGAPDGHLCTAEDVTEREQAQSALMRAVQHQQTALARLAELDRIRDDFVSSVSHELRTPVTSIIGFTELLLDDEMGELPDAQRTVLDRVERNGRRLLTLIEDLLTLSQIQTSGLRSELAPCDVREVVTRAVQAAQPTWESRRLALSVHLPERDLTLLGDRQQLERMLLNLISNAVKFTPDGGRVDVSAALVGDQVRLEVTDTGLGIPAAEQDQLFTRFYRSSVAAEHAIQGTGLGLSIVQAIVTQHEGEVRVASTEGAGTTVTVTLPRSPRGVAGAGAGPVAAARPVA